jgi:hypothetical protein
MKSTARKGDQVSEMDFEWSVRAEVNKLENIFWLN